jgi:replicative DNA helicase
MIDYLQLITDAKKGIKNRNQKISHIVQEIKNFAKKTGIVVILVSQLSRMIDHRDKSNQKPVLADLKESGDIEYASDIVLLLHRPFPLQSNEPVDTELIIAKNRDGRRAVVDLIWNPNLVRYENKRDGEAFRSQED